MGDGPITDVNALHVVSAAVAAEIERAANMTAARAAQAPKAAAIPTELATAPGEERWPVKTGQDTDVAEVGKKVIGGKDLGVGIVVTTIEELITAPRPPDMSDPKKNYDKEFHSRRVDPGKTSIEVTIWRVDATITAMKLEADGDYHLVLQGVSRETMIGEIPTPTSGFVGNSPWLENIKDARATVDEKFH